MEKKVYCLIGERCKRITFSSQKHIPDVQVIRDRLIEVSNNDILLQSMINNKIIVLQKFDPDRNDKLCDIEEDDEIQDKSEIKVLLFEKSSSLMDKLICTSVISDISQKEQIDETYAIDVKVIHTEPANLDNTKSFMEKSLIAIDDIEEKVNTSGKNNYLCDSILFKITIVYYLYYYKLIII